MSTSSANGGPRLITDGDVATRTNDFSKTADNALRLLALISEIGPVPTVQLAERSSLHRSVVRRLVNTLQHRGFIWSTPAGFVVGPNVLALAERVAPQLQAVIRPVMRALADEVGETVLCTMQQGSDAILLCQERGLRHLIRVEDEPGARHPIYLGGSGPAILSLLEDAEIHRCLANASSDESARAWDHIRDVRSHGYCSSLGERQRGVAAIAAPVAAPSGKPLCSLGVIVPEVREDELPGLAPTLLTFARRAERLLTAEVALARENGTP